MIWEDVIIVLAFHVRHSNFSRGTKEHLNEKDELYNKLVQEFKEKNLSFSAQDQTSAYVVQVKDLYIQYKNE